MLTPSLLYRYFDTELFRNDLIGSYVRMFFVGGDSTALYSSTAVRHVGEPRDWLNRVTNLPVWDEPPPGLQMLKMVWDFLFYLFVVVLMTNLL